MLCLALAWAQSSPENSKGVDKAVDKAVDATKSAAKKTASGTKTAARKTADSTTVAAQKTASTTKSAARKTADAFTPPNYVVNINSANEYQLKALPGIGDAKAAKIIEGRPYKSTKELAEKKILSDTEYSKLRGMVVVK